MNNFLKKKIIPITLLGLTIAGIASLSFSVAWFMSLSTIRTTSLNGAILKQYFDSSATADSEASPGSENNPFVITRPRHYENLIDLYYQMEGFAEENYYFEIGKQIKLDESDSSYYVYEYNDNGVYQDSVSKNLNIASLEELPPLGNDEHPFGFHIEGHNITVSGFSVSANTTVETDNKAFSDIGIFGFVGENGTCSNLYFDDFTIDITGGDAAETEGNEHKEYQHRRNTHIGYLAGHIVESANFTNVYVNNCTFSGTSGEYASVNNYGYYGAVERNADGEEFGTGNNYRFTLDSSAVYQYMQENYSTISGLPMQVRNTQYDNYVNSQYVAPTIDNPNPPVNFPFNNGVKTDNGYRLVGNYFDGSNKQTTARNYSLSTLGFYGERTETVVKDYEVYYNNNGNYVSPAAETKITTFALNDNPEQGEFFYYNKDELKWEYHHSENTTNTGTTNLNVNNFSFSKNSSMKGYPSSATVIVTLDDQSFQIPCSINETSNDVFTITPNVQSPIVNFTITFTQGTNGSWFRNASNGSISANFSSFTIQSLPRGNHYLSIVFNLTCPSTTLLGSTTKYAGYYGASVSNSVVTPTLISLLDTDGDNKTITPTFSTLTEGATYSSSPQAFYPIVYPSPNSYFKDLKGVNISEPNGYEDLIFRATEFEYELGKWYAQETGKIPILDGEGNPLSGPVYISDDAAIVGSGYSAENIDIVGGGIVFNDTFVNVQAESDNSSDTVTVAPTSSLIGQPFYATERTPNSIVLYLKNVGSDSNMGKIHLEYTTIAAIFGTNVKQPAFKKGGTNFIEFESITNATKTNSGQMRIIDVPALTKKDVRKASYCGIDENRNICAIYNSSGTLTAGDDSRVAYYVLAVGVKRDASSAWSWLLGRTINTTQINTISFEYKADAGSSGSFGTVGYRSAEDVVPHTLLNFYVLTPSGENNISITVAYDDTRKRYDITASASFTCEMYVYLNDTDNYTLYINGANKTSSFNTIVLSPS